MEHLEIEYKRKGTVSPEDFRNLLTTAIEGGSNYWYLLPDLVECNKWHAERGIETSGVPVVDKIFNYVWDGGGSVPIVDGTESSDDELWAINRDTIRDGFTRLANDYHEEWDQLKAGTWDADVADVWLQLTVIGEVQFG